MMTTRPLRALLAALIIAGLLIGAPLALLRWGQLDQLAGYSLPQIFVVPDGGVLALAALTAFGWLAWVSTALSLISELISTIGSRRLRIPGTRWFRPAAVLLVGALLGTGIAATPTLAQATPISVIIEDQFEPEEPLEDQQPVEMPSETVVAAPDSGEFAQYLVKPGDDLWSLAEDLLGDGSRWREIYQANDTLVLDPSAELTPGTVLAIPASPVTAALPGIQPTETTATVVVESGDTLWDIADDHLGDPTRWPEIAMANSDQIQDPDLIEPGWQLVLPSPVSQPLPVPQPEPTPVEPTLETPVTTPTTPVVIPEEAPTIPGIPATPTPVSATPHTPESVSVIETTLETDPAEAMVSERLGMVGTGLASMLLGMVLLRRQYQLRSRLRGRRMPLPTRRAQLLESALDRRAAVPDKSAVSQPMLLEEPRRYVQLGIDPQQNSVELDLHETGWLRVGGDPGSRDGVIAAIGAQLASGGPPAEFDLIMAGPPMRWLHQLDDMASEWLDTATTIERLRMVVADRQALIDQGTAPPGFFEPYRRVFVCGEPLDPLPCPPDADLIHMALTVIMPATDTPDLVVDAQGTAEIEGITFQAQLLHNQARAAAAELAESLDSPATETGPWWHPGWQVQFAGAHISAALSAPTSLATVTQPLIATAYSDPDEEAADMVSNAVAETLGTDPTPSATAQIAEQADDENQRVQLPVFLEDQEPKPRILVLGEVKLAGAKGTPPNHGAAHCLELLGWLMTNPGGTLEDAAVDLLAPVSTLDVTLNRLRTWLGATATGTPYLPDSYDGKLYVSPAVRSDWQDLASLFPSGVPAASDLELRTALQLVRGTPVADAAPGQWHWAEIWRTDIVSVIRDIAAVLAGRALVNNDITLARWALNHGALAGGDDDDELAMLRLRTEYQAGNHIEVQRLAHQIGARSWSESYDLSPEMVRTLQETIEGKPRSRAA